MIYNEFDQKTGEVKRLMAERTLRSWSEIFPSAYIMAIFACDRTVYEGFKFVAVKSENTRKEIIQL